MFTRLWRIVIFAFTIGKAFTASVWLTDRISSNTFVSAQGSRLRPILRSRSKILAACCMSIAAVNVVAPTLLSSSSTLAARWHLKLGSIPAHAAALANRRTTELFRAWRIPTDPIAEQRQEGSGTAVSDRALVADLDGLPDVSGISSINHKAFALAPEGTATYFSHTFTRAKVASTSNSLASTSSLDPLIDWRTYGLVPRTSASAKHLLLSANDAAFDIGEIEQILDSYRLVDQRANSKLEQSLEYESLLALLSERYAGTVARKKTKRVSSGIFLVAWHRLWTLKGDSLALAPSFAKYLLRQIMWLKATASAETLSTYETSLHFTALRHLLFQADLRQVSILALNFLTQTLLPTVSLHSTQGMFDAIPEISLDGSLSVVLPCLPSSVYAKDLPLLLHDLLRAGIISPDAIREFDLSSAVTKQSTLAARLAHRVERGSASVGQIPEDQLNDVKDAENLMRQVLLRIIARTYSTVHGKHAKAAVILRYLRPIDPIPSAADERLLHSICDAMSALPAASSQLHPDKVAQLAVTAALALQGKLSFLRKVDEKLLSDCTNIVASRTATTIDALISSAPITYRNAYGSAFLLLLQTKLGIANKVFSPLSLTTVESVVSAAAAKWSHGLRNCYKKLCGGQTLRAESRVSALTALLRDTASQISSGQYICDTAAGNAILYKVSVAHQYFNGKFTNASSIKSLAMCICDMLSAIAEQTPEKPFAISADNLALLAPVLASLDEPSISAQQVIQDFLRNRQDQPALDPMETSKLIQACVASGDRSAAMLLLRSQLDAKRIPAEEDIATILLDLARHSPDAGSEVFSAMTGVGFKPSPQLARAMILRLAR